MSRSSCKMHSLWQRSFSFLIWSNFVIKCWHFILFYFFKLCVFSATLLEKRCWSWCHSGLSNNAREIYSNANKKKKKKLPRTSNFEICCKGPPRDVKRAGPPRAGSVNMSWPGSIYSCLKRGYIRYIYD